MKWLVKIIRDEETNDIVAREVIHRTSSMVKPRGGEYELLEGPDTKHPKLEVVDSKYQVVEDVSMSTQKNLMAMQRKRMDFGSDMVALITVQYAGVGLDANQNVQAQTFYATVKTLLLDGHLEDAVSLMSALTPDETVTFQAHINAIINEFDANKADLGYGN